MPTFVGGFDVSVLEVDRSFERNMIVETLLRALRAPVQILFVFLRGSSRSSCAISLVDRLVAVTAIGVFLGFAGVPVASASDFRVGTARVDVTPTEPLYLGGHSEREIEFEGIDSELAVRALAIEDPSRRVSVIVSVETLEVPASVRERICGSIRGSLGIYRARVAVTATGTHSAPLLDGVQPLPVEWTPLARERRARYTRRVTQAAVEAVRSAVDGLAPASLGWTSTPFRLETESPSGKNVDRTIRCLVARSSDQTVRALLFASPISPRTARPERNRVSGDWPGSAARALEAELSGAIALPLASFDSQPVPAADPSGTSPRILGRSVAAAVSLALGRARADGVTAIAGDLDAQFEYVPLPLAPPSTETMAGPAQLWAFGNGLRLVFVAGEHARETEAVLRDAAGASGAWIVTRANAALGAIPRPEAAEREGAALPEGQIGSDHPARWSKDAIPTLARALTRLAENVGRSRVKPPPALSPAEGLASLETLDGLTVELVASEPEVVDPVAIAFDAELRLYACEMRDYPLGPGDGLPADGRVRRLLDRDRDGRYEESTIFADKVPYANGIACWQGGVFVTAETQILYLSDSTGDGSADVRRVVVDGFKTGNSQHLLNTLVWGPDHRLYGLAGDGGSVRIPFFPDRPPVKLGWTSFRFDPRTATVEPVTGGRGGYGIAFTKWGSRFVCSSTRHAIHVVTEERYLDRTPGAPAPDVHRFVASDRRVVPASPRLERFNDPFDVGMFSSACGVHIYDGDALPESSRGGFFVCEPVSNLVHRAVLRPRGATFTVERVEPNREFLASTDPWFRPVSCTSGPDGALYVVDMYREVIEHPEWIPADVQREFDLRSGMDRGRIYRVYRTDENVAATPLRAQRVEELARELSSRIRWRRETAARKFLERSGSEHEVEALERELRSSPDPRARRAALYVLEGRSELDAGALGIALRDPSAIVRRSAVQIAEREWKGDARDRTASEIIARAIAAIAEDPEPQIRFQVALSLGDAPTKFRRDPLRRILAIDAGDEWTRAAVLQSWPGDVAPLAAVALERMKNGIDGGGSLLRDVAALAAHRGDRADSRALLQLLANAPSGVDRDDALEVVLGSSGVDISRLFPAESPTAVRIAAILDAKAEVADDPDLPAAERARALGFVALGRGAAAVDRLERFLDARQPRELQRAAVNALGRVSGEARARVTAVFLALRGTLTPEIRAAAFDVLLADRERVAAVVDALERGDLSLAELGVRNRQRLGQTPDDELRARVSALVERSGERAAREEVVERYRRAITALDTRPGDRARGAEFFRAKCSTCHLRGGVGEAVGPDLDGTHQKSIDALLIDILDPNRGAEARYAGYSVATANGDIVSGLLLAETPAAIIVRSPGGDTHRISRADVEDLSSTGMSLMPEGLEEELAPRDVRDVIEFLRGPVSESGRPGAPNRP